MGRARLSKWSCHSELNMDNCETNHFSLVQHVTNCLFVHCIVSKVISQSRYYIYVGPIDGSLHSLGLLSLIRMIPGGKGPGRTTYGPKRPRPDSTPCSPTALRLYKPHFRTLPTSQKEAILYNPNHGSDLLSPTQMLNIGLLSLILSFRPCAANGPNFLVRELNGPTWPMNTATSSYSARGFLHLQQVHLWILLSFNRDVFVQKRVCPPQISTSMG